MSKPLWSSEMTVGVPSMDASHKTLLDKLDQACSVSDADFPAHYAALVARVESDFREEEELMEQIDYLAIRRHREQHAKLLGQLHHTAAAVMQGDIELGRTVVALLPSWFIFHFSTMDSALSFALQFQQSQR